MSPESSSLGGHAFRHEPPASPSWLVPRTRLLEALRGRFDRPLTVLVGGPGFGKTTVLAQSLLDNRLDALGTDLWLRVVDRDRVASHFIAGLAQSITGVANNGIESIDEVLDLIWTRTPDSLALVLDDVHLLGDERESVDVLRRLVAELPRNGHLVLSSRTLPPLPLARMESEGAALVLRERDLAFSGDELTSLADRLDVPDPVASRLSVWPALAVLSSRVGYDASIDYLWQEILAAMPDDRRRALAAVALFSVVDDDLVEAVAPGSPWTASGLLAGLPLIESDESGSYRLHDLWGTALDRILSPVQRRERLGAGASMLLGRGQHLRAAEAYAACGDTEGLVEVVRRFATQPLGVLSTSHVALLHQLLPPDLRAGPIGQYLNAATLFASDERQALVAFERVRAAAASDGDRSLEATAWWRVAQFESHRMQAPDNLDPRLLALADEGWPLARSAVALARSVAAQYRGDARAALAETEGFDRSDPVQYQGALRGRLLSLGRPEMIPAAVDAVLGGGSADVFDSQALWWRGEVPPELAWTVAVELHNTYADRRVAAVQVALDSVVATVALAAGRVADARRFADLAIVTAPRTMTPNAGFAGVADALVALVEHGEAEFAARFDKLFADVPLLPWPAWAYMSALAPIRALLPDGEQLDGLDVGPSLRVAIDAGRAVAELRRTGDPGVATTLPWEQINLLRVHVPVPMLCELVLAASATVPAANASLSQIPHCSRWIRRLVAHPSAAVRRAAEIAVKAYPPRPEHPLRITTLGRFAVECPPGTELTGWDRRERVRDLLAELVIRRSVPRSDLAAAIWPDLSPEKAANNLRVNLHHVQQLLEPGRSTDTPPAYLQGTATGLRLSADDVTIDIDLFDARIAEALAAERRGSPSQALAHYEEACDLYRGEFLPGMEQESVVNERTRLRSVAHGALCRRGELVLARGEPEIALALAAAAQQLDEMSERAGRLAIRCHLAVGSTSAACAVARHVGDVLADARVEPDPETRRLLERLAAAV